ncbi:hypothetical protein [Shewanella aestuarii]|uniref:Secreted protein n=1 Tax=Shewanella aestuarii TaxID=1028752 RepID=A0A6G9QN07_9GAMM|nr:hypothetical protein [Shewanella aestuarii]QIR15455.1 hypothetical protein HBH39_13880 [Shewanella aestuarii]
MKPSAVNLFWLTLACLIPFASLSANPFPAQNTIFGDENTTIGKVEMPKDVQQLTDFASKFGFLPPLSWKLAFHEMQGEMFMAEFIPANESLNNWSGLVCMQGFKGLANDIEPQVFLDGMADTYKEHCEGQVVYTVLGASEVEGLKAVHGILGCTVMPNIHHKSIFVDKTFSTVPKGEIGYFTVVSGAEDLYLIHKSIRTAVFKENKPPLDATNYRDFMANN